MSPSFRLRKARTKRPRISKDSFQELLMKASSVFIALLLTTVAAATINIAEAPGQSGRGSVKRGPPAGAHPHASGDSDQSPR